jgi:hypothetical protein
MFVRREAHISNKSKQTYFYVTIITIYFQYFLYIRANNLTSSSYFPMIKEEVLLNPTYYCSHQKD